jgi:hypothetical protein
MNSFTVQFHDSDGQNSMTVEKLSKEDFDRRAAGGTRQLFELDTDFGYFLFLDGADGQGEEGYFLLRFTEGNDSPADFYAFRLKDFYDLAALYLSQNYFDDEEEEEEPPVQLLVHLLYHIVEAGRKE